MAIFYKISRSFLQGAFSLLYKHTAIMPAEGIYPHAALIAANHTSFLDPPLIAASLQEEVFFLANNYLFTNPFFRTLITSLNAHPVSKNASDIATLRTICALLKDGKKVVIFPEGTRSHDNTIAPFKRGLGLLAEKAHCPIIPTYIHGASDAWPRGQRLPRLFGAKTACHFGSPIFLSQEGRQGQELLAKQTYEAILELRI